MVLGSDLITIIRHQSISIDALSYILGGREIYLHCNVDCEWQLNLHYLVPMAGSTGIFGTDRQTTLTAKFKLDRQQLKQEATVDWQPRLFYKDGKIVIGELPSALDSKIELMAYQAGRKVFAAKVTVGKILLEDEKHYAEALANNTKSLEISVLLARGLAETLRENQTQRDLLASALSALHLLNLHYDRLDAPIAKRVNVKTQVLESLVKVADALEEALDVSSGLVFRQVELNDYYSPSYVVTAISLILWHELAEVFKLTKYRRPLAAAIDKWLSLKHAEIIEPLYLYQLAKALTAAYENRSVEFSSANLSPLTKHVSAFLPLNADPTSPYISLPKKARTSLDAFEKEHKALKGYWLTTALSYLPYGYMWRMDASPNNTRSIWVGILAAFSEAAATSYFNFTSKNVSGVERVLLSDCAPTTSQSVIDVSELLEKIPNHGIGKIEWSAYLLGFLPVSTELQDYKYATLPPQLQTYDIEPLQTINAANPINLTTGDIEGTLSPLKSLPSIVLGNNATTNPHIGFASPYREIDSELEPLANNNLCYVVLKGIGKTKELSTYLNARLMAGYKAYLHTYTWSETISRARYLNEKETNVLLVQTPAQSQSQTQLELTVEIESSIVAYANTNLALGLELSCEASSSSAELPSKDLYINLIVYLEL